MVRPNTVIVGGPKCGTSSLASYLGQHPHAFISNPKEPLYWATDYPNVTSKMPQPIDTLCKYEGLFAEAHHCSVRAEASAIYLSSDSAVRNLLQYAPEIKFIALVRNPVDLVYAYHQQMLFAHFEDEADFETAWGLQPTRVQGERVPVNCPSPELLHYRRIGSLGQQIERFFDAVPASQRIVFRFDQLVKEPRVVWRKLLDFLDLEDDGRIEFPVVNQAKSHRFRMISTMIMSPPALLQPLAGRLRTWSRTNDNAVLRLAKTALKRQAARHPLRPEFRQLLTEDFRKDTELLAKLLQCDLKEWTSA
ncbi:sulfotransferase domain-containing protein [Rhodopirellula bahusiensis]|uniref:Sulfotransferase domain-containing protein n=1 Tax=Rhodopirellula bahusiensis TaxID=2014065 RepID=A0A2G1W5G2_9BACT|nr:sulfotransferase [Rhodopirellula bahusiensis]PHQ34283.1 hypothetical protein CEE69_16790 [Rhodopirellula bahusiensis]